MSLKQALKKVPAGVPLPWKFHHEIWEKPWESQSGDFPPHETELEHGQRQRQIKSERWFRHHRDIHWENVVDAIRENIFVSLKIQLQEDRDNNENAYRLLCDGYRSLEFKNKVSLDGATIEQIREQFKDVVMNEFFAAGTRFSLALQSFICYPQPVKASDLSELDAFERNGAWVTVVDPEYKPGSYTKGKPRFYQGYMRCHLNRLLSLAWAGSMKHMSKMIRRDADGIPWYEENI
ncbi:uncharacterized protein N7469_005613 [Penicillium citrinum]|uniref:Uncharacterized protein n=1 Tax=Penicillium citrinum TaxID=5077 RepID=A0A9W9P489_PENCI|nr:uncharacterized protein N7469_005613 [Penicillium citrinum]KAJ5233847.1 hypothetical protein N7469_005613 [Penicillium citrinum]